MSPEEWAKPQSPGGISQRIFAQLERDKPSHIDAELGIAMVAASLAATAEPKALKRMLKNIEDFYNLLEQRPKP